MITVSKGMVVMWCNRFLTLLVIFFGVLASNASNVSDSKGKKPGLTKEKQGMKTVKIYISTQGDDASPGTFEKPLASVEQAQMLARTEVRKGENVEVIFRGGTYRLKSTLVFTPEDSPSKGHTLVYRSQKNEVVKLTGSEELRGLNWIPYRDGIFQTKVGVEGGIDQLFIDGEAQPMARYPNYDPLITIYNGYAEDAISPERVTKWKDPSGGYIHAQHDRQWGGFSWQILGKNGEGELNYIGGWQNNRPSVMHPKYRFVENIFEELDAPGEWFFDVKKQILFYYPPRGADLKKVRWESPRLERLVEFRGTVSNPVRGITLQGLIFSHTLRTFMKTKEPLLRTDWTIYRGAAIYLTGAEDCVLQDLFLNQLGGNGIFVDGYNQGVVIRGSHFYKIGGGGINFVGSTSAVRNGLDNYDKVQSLSQISNEPGPANELYPRRCQVEDCLIHQTGEIEKQSAPVNIDIASEITVRHCSIYDCPRAGINIGDGCWGGHLIEFCDVFNTVLETGDHGSFNAWGRDRWWRLNGVDLNKDIVSRYPDLPKWDTLKPIQLINNRWRCDHGWDIDLDDGASHYIIRNNLCLNGGIKNREGFYRAVENNIIVNNSFHPHVWYRDSGDVFRKNIVFTPYRPALMKPEPWGKEMDYNFLHQKESREVVGAKALQDQSMRDQHSLAGNAMFVNPESGDYRVNPGSPAQTLGFENFPMDQFGVQKPDLKKISKRPRIPSLQGESSGKPVFGRKDDAHRWRGVSVRNIRDEGEMSVYGTSGVSGVLVLEIGGESELEATGLMSGDVIVSVNGVEVKSVSDLVKWDEKERHSKNMEMRILRAQKLKTLGAAPVK